MLNATVQAVRDQGLEFGYLIQEIPVIGVIPSAMMMVGTGMMAVVQIAKTFFKSLGATTTPVQQEIVAHKKNAKDHGLLFLNNLLNICTLGVLNAYLVRKEVLAINDFYRNGDY